MGQAKRRGSFEDRKDLASYNAIEDRRLKDAEDDRRDAEEQARVDAMPEEARAAYVDAYRARKPHRTNMAGLLAITALSMGGRF